MLLKYFYNEDLAHASYLVGCQKTGDAIVIDPSRNIEPYVQVCKANGLRLTAGAETHIHADFVSGLRELASRFDAKLYVSGEGNTDWQYEYAAHAKHQRLQDGDQFKVGHLAFKVVHTPGHTPESISLLLTDEGGGADEPIGIFTGDFIFAGDVGRPDLLESAAGYMGTAEQGAKDMFRSIQQFKELPDYLQVWPAHGAGSACGKSLGAIPSTTVGYEKRFNPSLQYTEEAEFVRSLLDGQPEPPSYFSRMKRINKEGPGLMNQIQEPAEYRGRTDLHKWLQNGTVIDTRGVKEFRKGHIPGTINIPFDRSFVKWAGWLVNGEEPLYLLVNKEKIKELQTALYSIGIDRIDGYMDATTAIRNHPALKTYEEIEPRHVRKDIENGCVTVLDVRNQNEWDTGRLPNAMHMMLGMLPNRLKEIPKEKPIVVYCASGIRSAIAVSVLQTNGFTAVKNLSGGLNRWKKELAASKV